MNRVMNKVLFRVIILPAYSPVVPLLGLNIHGFAIFSFLWSVWLTSGPSPQPWWHRSHLYGQGEREDVRKDSGPSPHPLE